MAREMRDKDEARNENVVRCKACITRFKVEPGAESAKCPECETEWRISWPDPHTPYVRGIK
jgi:LSD1 subclass zinc finger protein